ncbi:AAA family ATPase, partial [Deferrisoma palaeochoriense]
MIEFLRVRDFAIVDRLDLELGPGFTVLTGETGAGKSILLQALGLLLGDRASRDWVRAGAPEARVEGAFAPPAPAAGAVGAVLEEAGVPWDPAEPLVVTRVVAADGRSRAHVNGALVPLHVLARVGSHLVEVSSQHQHQSLLREEEHLALLDAGLDEEGRRALAAWQEAYGAWHGARAEVDRLERLDREGRDRAEFLRFQIGEIRAAGLEPGEDERLRAERDLLAHATKLREAYEAAEAELYTADTAALSRLGRAQRALEAATRWDPEAAAAVDLVAEAMALVDEAAAAVRRRLGEVE